ncbi:MAG: hypothetical protein JST78_04000 [Bacteroidetes bacterium]|nr:hypothetical protein [Bacteroidota bacterium]
MFVLDSGYTYVYQSAQPRNKLQYIIQLNQQKFDVVFLGSSRVANHIDSELFDQLSHKKSINLGVQGANLVDNLLQLKLFLSKNSTDYLFLQIDDNLEYCKPSNISQAEAMPFLNNPIVSEHSKKFIDEYVYLKYIPFYRYALNDAKIGFRELFFSAIGKKPSIDFSKGFMPKYGHSIPNQPRQELKEVHGLNQNPILREMKALCQEHQVHLVLFISPYCSKIDPENYIKKMKLLEPNLIDLSQGYDDSLFFNCGHLNQKGAEIFTQRLYTNTQKLLSAQEHIK